MKPLYNFILTAFFLLSGTLTSYSQTGTFPFSPNYPHCAFDELNQAYGAELRQEIKDYVKHAVPDLAAQTRNAVEPLLSVAVVVHVIHEGEPIGSGRNISDAQIEAQIKYLNEDFSSLNSQYFNTPGTWMNLAGTPNIQFCLANIDPNGNPTNGINRVEMEVTGSSWNSNNINSTIKPAVNWDPEKYLNIYVVSIPGTTAAGGVVGYSNYPTPGLVGAPSDGPVIDYNWFGAPGFPASGYRPVTHELGHYFGLPHTFNGNSCSSDDNISDTPEIEEATRAYMQNLDCATGYPAGPNSCGNDHLYVNYMDYVNENCYTSFTQGQVNVIRSVLEGTSNQFNYGSREGLIDNAPLLCNLSDNDAGIVRLISPAESYCTADSVVPEVTLRNFGVVDLESATISYQINGGDKIEMEWEGSLFPGENVDLVLPKFLPPNGEYTIEIFTENPNGQVDERIENDVLEETQFVNLAVRPPYYEDFEGEIGLPTSNGFWSFNPNGDDLFWRVSQETSAFGEGQTSAVIDNFAIAGQGGTLGTIDALITRHFDLREMENTELRFEVAYAPQSTLQSDTLLVLIATECSQNFNQLVFSKGGNQLSTAPATSTEFTPSSSQWRTEVVDLSAYDGMDDVTIAFVNLSGWGNRMFIDNLRVGLSCSSLTAVWQTTTNGCGMACDGTASVELPENNGGLEYSWEGWPSSHNQSSVYQLCPGEINVTISDDFGCEIIATSEIQQAAPPVASTSSIAESGLGFADGSATVNVNNGIPPFVYQWSTGSTSNSNSFSNTISDLEAGQYSVTVTDDTECSSVFDIEVESACAGFTVSTPVTNASCFGEANGSVLAFPLNGQSPFEYFWSNGANTQIATDLAAGEYTVTVVDANGCPTEKTATVGQPDELVLTVNSTHETASNANDGTVSVLVDGGSPGYEYLWNNGSEMPFQTGLPPGNYSVIVTDLAGCQEVANVIVLPFTCDDFSAVISWDNVSCFALEDGNASVAVSGETPPVSYNWNNGATTSSIENLPAGDYVVTVSDDAGCMAELVASILQPNQLFSNVSSTDETMPGAEDGTATVMPSGGLTFPGNGYSAMWSNGESTLGIENLAPGFYFVTVADGNNCEVYDTVLIDAAGCNLSIETSITPASCPNVADGLAIVTEVPGGVMPLEYAWSNGDADPFAENLLPDTYFVTVTDANGCSTITSVQISAEDNDPPTLQILSEYTVELDGDGVAFLTPNEIDNGSFDNCSLVEIQLGQEEFTCDDLGEVELAVTAVDANSNSSDGTITIVVVDMIAPVITCPDDLTILTCDTVFFDLPVAEDNCGDADIEFLDGFEPGEIFPSGTTTVTYGAVDFSDNTSECSFNVTVEYDLLASLSGTDPSCAGEEDGSLDLIITGGTSPYQAEWSHGGNPVGLPAGEYSVTVTDQNGCTITDSFELIDPPPFSAEVFNVTPATDINTPGSIVLNINGGNTPWILTWFEDGVELPDFDPQFAPPGMYSVTIADQNGCEISIEDILVDNLNNVANRELDQQVDIFPNPNNGHFFLKTSIPQSTLAVMTIHEVSGKKVMEREMMLYNGQTLSFEIANAVSGVYWVNLKTERATIWRKLVVK